MHFLQNISSDYIKDNAYLNILLNEDTLYNPLVRIPPQWEDRPELYLTYLMQRPEYFYFFINKILGLNMLPLHMSVTLDLWKRKFPILLGTRGFGKLLKLDEKIRIRGGWTTMGDVQVGDKVYGSDGKLTTVTWKSDVQENVEMYQISLGDGRWIDACEDHTWKIIENDKYRDVRTKELCRLIEKNDIFIPLNKEIDEPDRKYDISPYDMGLSLREDIKNLKDVKIPNEYKYGSIKQKEDFLLGVSLDFHKVNGSERIVYLHTNVLNEICDIYRSLGYYCSGGVYNGEKQCFLHIKDLDKVKIGSVKYIGRGDGACISVDNTDHTYITKDYIVTHNTYTLALYTLLQCIFLPGRKAVVAGSGFRQSKLIFEYMEKMWDDSKILRSAMESLDGPKKGTDQYNFKLGSSNAKFIPLGSGGTIRGLRANLLICVSKDTLVQTDKGLIEISDYLDGGDYKVMNHDYEFEKPSCIVTTEPTDVYEITTRYGFSFKCSDVHRVMTNSGWKTAKDLEKGDFLLLDTNDYFPEDYYEGHGIKVDEDLGWLTGILISEGSVETRTNIGVTNTDCDLIQRIKKRIPFDWKEYYKPAHMDNRGWNCKECWNIRYCCTEYRENLYKLGLDYAIHRDKKIPKYILRSPKSVVIEFLKGIFEGDGTGFTYEDRARKNRVRIRISYYSSSKKLCKDLQTLLLKFGILGGLCNRSSKLSIHPQWALQMNGENAYKLYALLKLDVWGELRPDMVFRTKKPIITKNYHRYVLSTWNNNKNTYISSHATEEECYKAFDKYWKTQRQGIIIKSVVKLPEKEVLYDFHIPEKHSFVGNGFVQHNCDEFASINPEVFEQVVAGFAAVSSDPIGNVKRLAYEKFDKQYGDIIKNMGVPWCPAETEETKANQIIISGTADYQWNHFYRYYERYRKIIYSKGDKRKLKSVFPEGVPNNFKWDQYAIYRIPIGLIPDGFMDADSIARSKATIKSHIYGMEYEAIFSKDSQGFFPRSKIEECTITNQNSIDLGDGPIHFKATMLGDPNCRYVYGLDSAAESDNLAIVILELHPNHRRIVHCWTTRKEVFRDKVKAGVVQDQSFLTYVCNKIRELIKRFPCDALAIDAQGGGNLLAEELRNPLLVDASKGEKLILEHIDPAKGKDTDGLAGDHLIHTIQFANSKWTAEANHGLKNDIENKSILFPFFDGAELAMAFERDEAKRKAMGIKTGISFDTLEDVIDNIAELKTELSNIVHSRTPNGTERWDTPEVKTGGKSVSHLKKDRYSALVMANSIAANIEIYKHRPIETNFGGTLDTLSKEKGNCYAGGLLAEKLNHLYDGFSYHR